MQCSIEVNVMNRGMLSDEFIGYASIPLHEYEVYDRPTCRWVQLGQKPSKLPDGRCRGELEVRLSFHVKSRSKDSSPSNLKNKHTGSIKSLVTAVGDKLKFSKTNSLRGDGSQIFSTPQPNKQKKVPGKPALSSEHADTSAVTFDAVDLYVPEQCWRENEFASDLGDGNFARSYSLTTDKRRHGQDYKSRSLMNLPGEHSATLPSRGRARERPTLDSIEAEQWQGGVRSSRGSVTSHEGYLESMFRRECEVDEQMARANREGIEEEEEGEEQRRVAAQFYGGSDVSEVSSDTHTSSQSDSDELVELPKVRLKKNLDEENSDVDDKEVKYNYSGDENDKTEGSERHDNNHDAECDENDTNSDVFNPSASPCEYTGELDRVIARENSRRNSETLNSRGTSDGRTSTHTSSSSISYQGKSASQRAYERGSSDSMSSPRRKISPLEQFSITSQTSNEENKGQRRKSKLYAKGGRRYTVQGIPSHRSAPDIRDQRPVFSREESVPGDLMAVYRNMNREELIKLVVTHKAQLIRKDQYIQELESYIDNLLVRVMETSPRILQNL
ncbi:rab11 family-interacting protein 5-like isoform X3 [Dreissena polymorpha]|nr:rab11 family-interacting protein 5-like isoform X3 [Dreissena polymorpha]